MQDCLLYYSSTCRFTLTHFFFHQCWNWKCFIFIFFFSPFLDRAEAVFWKLLLLFLRSRSRIMFVNIWFTNASNTWYLSLKKEEKNPLGLFFFSPHFFLGKTFLTHIQGRLKGFIKTASFMAFFVLIKSTHTFKKRKKKKEQHLVLAESVFPTCQSFFGSINVTANSDFQRPETTTASARNLIRAGRACCRTDTGLGQNSYIQSEKTCATQILRTVRHIDLETVPKEAFSPLMWTF